MLSMENKVICIYDDTQDDIELLIYKVYEEFVKKELSEYR